ncbi:hypothetical protein BD324DRAFT_47138 [Kockovaella imperatae]|uniref:Uncharacterized protein n=1 Tax=Kockovaella imperatae TaxID=4999 RepID=A0A1Y1UT36_9TREE|nr:hypothetical protein BD324DRAFT_47138 [Kockovaella imperatae]ORX41178.1 hypothetical protein BD324DRAFT_47138 [Kockovaella imperatae]
MRSLNSTVSHPHVSTSSQPSFFVDISINRWWGDDGPYHLLLTPTQHVEHGYNVWEPSLPADSNKYNLTIRQPTGTHFLLTMWGASGISYAATTDVMTVGAPLDNTGASCFYSDADILSLYSFSFNISDSGSDFPPQCSNLTLSWPTSLEQNVTGFNGTEPAIKRPSTEEIPSSSKHKGNTTYPPTMFGVIPLGNSFSIPITYDVDSPFADSLPPESLSDQPTTWTYNGETNLNWTIDLAKGTRFILVAGIGGDSQWASGGSSEMMTVGQGLTGCVGSEDYGGNGVPTITATGTSSSYPTVTLDEQPTSSSAASSGRSVNVVKTIVACVISVLGTLTVVGLVWFFIRLRRQKRDLAGTGNGGRPGSAGGYRDSFVKKRSVTFDSDTLGPASARDYSSTDFITMQDRHPVPTHTDDMFGPRRTASPDMTDFAAGSSDEQFTPTRRSRLPLSLDPQPAPIRGFDPSGTVTSMGTYSSPISPVGSAAFIRLDAESSQDALLQKSHSRSLSQTVTSTFTMPRQSAGLRLHDRGSRQSVGEPGEEEEDEHEDGDISDLKLETIAAVDQGGLASSSTGGARSRRRRPRRIEGETEYVVHRDAGRIHGGQSEHVRRVELPPRYEELNWEEQQDAMRGDASSRSVRR